jgi:hypothetical protein
MNPSHAHTPWCCCSCCFGADISSADVAWHRFGAKPAQPLNNSGSRLGAVCWPRIVLRHPYHKLRRYGLWSQLKLSLPLLPSPSIPILMGTSKGSGSAKVIAGPADQRVVTGPDLQATRVDSSTHAAAYTVYNCSRTSHVAAVMCVKATGGLLLQCLSCAGCDTSILPLLASLAFPGSTGEGLTTCGLLLTQISSGWVWSCVTAPG